ncbi:hypothetical protein EFV37_01030 [Mesorhizobium loti]|uniref:Uncharacterized protein n=1 Tax=Mesorhizobium jarvisii TaxID=1777867 RepID=A0A6M7T8R3_9HYPH|nr:hypothetical protein A9K72_19005 [Mesorhizobium loti]QKC61055.1 hypothetical protein EB229_01030 [Mesorhizobium jarvisii]QKD06964.1 hypothetical protein EFV37_01030 [Mesorhizobium loti]RJT34533.1 hypothetical protein D3242_11995 [Mesorhizobium jarvisii]
MVAVINGDLGAFPGDKPLRLLWLIEIGRAGQAHIIAVFGLSHGARVYRMAIFVAAAIIAQNRVFFAGIPIVGICVAGQEKPCQRDPSPWLFHDTPRF